MEDYEERDSGSSAENAVIGRSIVARYLSVVVWAVALMPGVDSMVGVRLLDVTVGVEPSICEFPAAPPSNEFEGIRGGVACRGERGWM